MSIIQQQQQEPIGYFSSLCQELYNPKSPSERDQVQKILETSFPTFTSNPGGILFDQVPSFHIATPTDTANALRILLENSPNPYVQIFSFSRLKQLVLDQFTFFDTETKLQLRTFLLEYAYLHPDLQPFVITQLASVMALITKFGWMDIPEYQNVFKDINQFLIASSEHRIVGLHLFSVIIQDLNTAPSPKFSAKFRKAAMGFRDTQLFDIVKKTYEIFQGILNKTLLFDKPDQEDRTKDFTLDLLYKCLSYDFAGISIDESGEDTATIQIPSEWKCLYEEQEFVSTFFKAYDTFTASSQVMDCLVLIAATRKALFTNDDTKNKHFLDRMMQGIQDIISHSTHLNDPDCYVRFCRLLYRFRTNAPLSEMASKTNYIGWIDMVAGFTKTAFQTTTFQAAYYLLGFWSRIIQNMSYSHYLDETVKKKLQELSVELSQSFITACVDTTRLEEMFEDPLEDEETLVDSLDMLGELSRCQYEKSCTALIDLFEEESTMSMMAEDLMKQKLTWFVYIMACYLGSRPPYVRIENHDLMDGKLVAKVVQIMDDTSNNERLELAILYFFMQFKKSYVGEAAKPMYKVLNETYGIDSEGDMLNVIMRKIMVNLQKPGQSELMIQKTLQLLNELASGYSSLRTLRKMESTLLLLENHDVSIKDRLLYYQILSKILFAEDDCEREFNEFMKPFKVRLDQLAMINTVQEFQQHKVQLENVFIDLRGLIMPITSRKNYLLFFNWFYPEYMPVLIKGIQACSPMTHKLLKFLQEFVHNKNQRLNLDTSSANSILLFRDVSQILCSYGQSVIGISTAEHQKYKMKYKGMSICFDILAKCLGGKYINFGVFWLYGDQAIHDAFSSMLQMMLNIPLDDMMAFPKLTHHYFAMLDEFSSEQMMMYNQLPPEAFLYIIASCEQGIESNESLIRSHACSTILHLCTFVIEKKTKDVWFLNYFEQFPHVVPQLLTHLFGLLLFDDHQDPWQLSRPLYALVLLDRNVALKFTEEVILHQLPERRDFVTKALSQLMEGIGWTISSKDRERFSQQVATFKRELNNQQIVLLSV